MVDKSPRLLAALELAERGIPCFPCIVNGKEPATVAGFKDATVDPVQIEAWWAQADYNVAIEPERAGWAVVDIESDGAEEWDNLLRDNGVQDWEIDTLVARTPRGGWHYYFEGSCASSVKKLAPHIDTRGRGGYVLVPPSVVNGKPYSYESMREPSPLLSFIEPKLAERKHSALAAAVENIDPELAWKRGLEVLTNKEVASADVTEGHRDITAFKVACLLKDAGCDEEQSFLLLHDVWNKHVYPPLDDDVLRQKIESASRNSQNERGAQAGVTVEEAFKTFVPPTDARLHLPNPVKLSDLPDEDEPVAQIVDFWIQTNKINLLRGRGGANKSRLALQWAIQIDAGKNGLGFKVEKAAALYLSCEDDRSEVTRRKNAIMRKLGIKQSGVLYFDMTDEEDAFLCRASDGGGVERLAKWDDLEARMNAIEGPKLLVLDSTYDVIDFAGSTKNSDTHVRTIIRLFDRLCRRTNCTIICLWHPSRAGMARGDEGGFATAWDNAPRNAISIKKLEDDDTFELKAEKRNNLALGKPSILRWAEGTLVLMGEDDASRIMEHDAVVEVAIEAAKQGEPIKHGRKPMTWVYDFIKERTGRTVKLLEIRDVLAREARRDNARLYYHVDGTGHGKGGPSGYYPKKHKEDWEV